MLPAENSTTNAMASAFGNESTSKAPMNDMAQEKAEKKMEKAKKKQAKASKKMEKAGEPKGKLIIVKLTISKKPSQKGTFLFSIMEC